MLRAAAEARAQVPAVDGLLLDLGGRPGRLGRAWTVAVQDPRRPEENARLAAAAGRCRCGHHGGYQRYYSVNGTRHCT
ncbi:MAG: hypothetical protein U0736_02430 [Gemmataceae bacterium]